MQIKIKDNTVVITIMDDESNSGDKDAFLDALISNWANQVSDRTFLSDRVEYRIDRALWKHKGFRAKFLWLELSL
jgi:hypothetical protein